MMPSFTDACFRPEAEVCQQLIFDERGLMNYVSAVTSESVRIVTSGTMSPDIEALATHIGSGEAHLPFSSKVELAEVLTVLQRAKLCDS